MDERLATYVKHNTDGSDLLLSAFSCAAQSYRRATVCKPFPAHLFSTPQEDRDYASLSATLETLPPSSSIPSSINPTQAALLEWLLLERNTERDYVLVDVNVLTPALSRCCGWPPDPYNPSLHPSFILAIQDPAPTDSHATSKASNAPSSTISQPTSTTSNPPVSAQPATPSSPNRARVEQSTPFSKSMIAFHGTSFENIHSILHNGLLNVSGTSLQRNGSLFGKGIYLSSDYRTAFGYSAPGPAWSNSRLGSRLRCVLVCEVDTSPDSLGSKVLTGLDAAAGASAQGDQGLPQTYWLVKSPDAIKLRYILVYRDQPPRVFDPLQQQHQHAPLLRWLAGINWLAVLPVLYAMVMVLIGLRE